MASVLLEPPSVSIREGGEDDEPECAYRRPNSMPHPHTNSARIARQPAVSGALFMRPVLVPAARVPVRAAFVRAALAALIMPAVGRRVLPAAVVRPAALA